MYTRNPLLEPTANNAAIQTPMLWPDCCYIQVDTMPSFITLCNCVVDADITMESLDSLDISDSFIRHAVACSRPVHHYLQPLGSVTAYWTSDHLGQLLLLFDSQLGAMWATVAAGKCSDSSKRDYQGNSHRTGQDLTGHYVSYYSLSPPLTIRLPCVTWSQRHRSCMYSYNTFCGWWYLYKEELPWSSAHYPLIFHHFTLIRGAIRISVTLNQDCTFTI